MATENILAVTIKSRAFHFQGRGLTRSLANMTESAFKEESAVDIAKAMIPAPSNPLKPT